VYKHGNWSCTRSCIKIFNYRGNQCRQLCMFGQLLDRRITFKHGKTHWTDNGFNSLCCYGRGCGSVVKISRLAQNPLRWMYLWGLSTGVYQTCSQVLRVRVQVQVQVFDSKSKSRESIMSMSQLSTQHTSFRSLIAFQCQNEDWPLRQVIYCTLEEYIIRQQLFEHGGALLWAPRG